LDGRTDSKDAELDPGSDTAATIERAPITAKERRSTMATAQRQDTSRNDVSPNDTITRRVKPPKKWLHVHMLFAEPSGRPFRPVAFLSRIYKAKYKP
jgi:hypothetical protein